MSETDRAGRELPVEHASEGALQLFLLASLCSLLGISLAAKFTPITAELSALPLAVCGGLENAIRSKNTLKN